MTSSTVETIRSETLREQVDRVTLPGGLTLYFCPKPGFRKRYACYSTFYGSVDNHFRVPGRDEPVTVPDGIAHFLEHTLFETREGNVSDLFARNGAYNNAATSFSTTTYLFASAERFLDNLGLLINFVENPVFDPVKVDKERGIIEQEIQRYRDDPGWVGYMGLLESLFKNHPMRIDIAGTPESIARIDSATLHDCHKTFYDPRNMILFVTGDLDRDEVLDFVSSRSRAGAVAAKGNGGASTNAPKTPWVIERLYPDEPEEVASDCFTMDMEVAQAKLLVGYKETGVPRGGRELLMKEVASDFVLDVLFGRGSDAFTRLYLAQLIQDDFSASYSTCAGVGFVVMGGETPDPDGLRRELEKIVAQTRDRGLDDEDFERQKRKFIGSFVRCFNSLEFIASNYTAYRFHDLDLFEVVDVLDRIGKDEVESRIRTLINPEHRSISLVRPKSR